MQIKIWWTDQDDGGWMFDVFLAEDVDEDTEPDDGGMCTGEKADALAMAMDTALELLKITNK
jgi:hypothetical protein